VDREETISQFFASSQNFRLPLHASTNEYDENHIHGEVYGLASLFYG
jgi:hypothetical protein